MPKSRNNRKGNRNVQKLADRILREHRANKAIQRKLELQREELEKAKQAAVEEVEKMIEARKQELAERKAEIDAAIEEVKPIIEEKIQAEESRPKKVRAPRKKKEAETPEMF